MAKGKGKGSGSASRNKPPKSASRPATKPAAKPAAARDTAGGESAEPRGDVVGRARPDAATGAGKGSSGPRRRPAPTKRTTPPASARYTPPVPKSEKVSPVWVPVVMFSCLGVGMLTIILNYVNVLPGPDPSNTYLMIGLALITVGFITATKYH